MGQDDEYVDVGTYDEELGVYWLTPMHAYGFSGTEEDQKRIAKRKWGEIELEEYLKHQNVNRFIRKYGLVSYRCKRGCLLVAVLNVKSVKYIYAWSQTRCDWGFYLSNFEDAYYGREISFFLVGVGTWM